MGKVKAVSISKTKGVRKENKPSICLKEDFGIVGDAHAGTENRHPGGHRQVSLLASESIDKMKAKGLNVSCGDFAENITTEGIDLLSLKIGSQIKIGNQVILEISQIGKVCHRRCNIYYQAGDCVMPREGVFARVVKGGVIKPEDEIVPACRQAGIVSTKTKGDMMQKKEKQAVIYTVAVLTISDKCSQGQREDESGKVIQELAPKLPGKVVKYEIIPDEPEMIKEKLINYCDQLKVDLVLTNGGTGFTARDRTPEATREVIEREAPGIPEAMRTECLRLTKRAMLSRGIAGLRAKTLIINLPGSTRGAQESFEAIIEGLPHGLDMVAEREH